MNKTLNINLGGIPLIIDEDAYDRLDQYMHHLEIYFHDSEGRNEILTDIEARFAELLNERLKTKSIVDLEDVEAAIAIMGTAEDFESEQQGEAYKRTRPAWDIKTGKKLFRDPDDKVIGGVCSGLAAYFGIEDPIWVRLAFAVIFLTFGVGLLAYIILWAIVPEAKTASDRLAMMGEPANVRNIARMVESGVEEITDALKDIGREFKKKRNRRRKTGSFDHYAS